MRAEAEALRSAIKWIFEANTAHDIKDALRETYPKANADKVIGKAIETIQEIGREDEEFLRGWAIGATRELVRKMIEVGDFSNAVRAIKQVKDIAAE